MSKVEFQQPGVETRLKMKQRGFYHDKHPGFAAVASHVIKAVVFRGGLGLPGVAADHNVRVTP